MIGLDHQNVRAPNPFDDQFGGMTEIRQETDVLFTRSQHEPDRVVRIVRHGKRFHTHLTHFERTARAEDAKIEPGLELHLDRFLGQAIAKDRNGQFGAERAEPVRVIGMLVREENARKTFRRTTDLGEPFPNLPGAEPGINQQARVSAFEVSAITIRTAAQDRELNRHAIEARKSRDTSQRFSKKFRKELARWKFMIGYDHP